MYIKKLSILTFLSLIFPVFVFCQNNYKAGYIVNLKGETVKGYIDYREWTRNPKSFDFKSSISDASPQKLTVNNVKAFGIFNLEYFSAAKVNISTANVQTGSLSRGMDTKFITDSVFLRLITTGKNVALYAFTDNIKTRFYIQDKQNAAFTELDYFVFMEDGDNAAEKTVSSFRKQLTGLAVTYQPADNALSRRIQQADYNELQIKAIVKAINGGENETFSHEKLSRGRLLLGAGINSDKLKFSSLFSSASSNVVPEVTLGGEIILNKNTKKIVFRAEITGYRDHYSFKNTGGSTDLISGSSLDVKQFNVIISPQLIYNFYSGDNLQAFFGAGVALNLSFYNNYAYVVNYFDGTSNSSNKSPSLSTFWSSFPLKAGVLISDQVELHFTYVIPTSISNVDGDYSATRLTSYQVGISYLFGK